MGLTAATPPPDVNRYAEHEHDRTVEHGFAPHPQRMNTAKTMAITSIRFNRGTGPPPATFAATRPVAGAQNAYEQGHARGCQFAAFNFGVAGHRHLSVA